MLLSGENYSEKAPNFTETLDILSKCYYDIIKAERKKYSRKETEQKKKHKGDESMIKTKIRLVSIDDVKSFVKKANLLDYDVDLSLGKYTVDGKSIMGIFSLDLSRDIELTIHSDSEDFLNEIRRFIVE